MPLNDHNQPEDAPVAQARGLTPAYYFFSENERNSVSASRIKSINFAAGTGGTVNIGGSANNIDRISIYNAAGAALDQIDINGFTLFGTTSLQYYDTSLGSYTAGFGPMTGTAFIQTIPGIPLTITAGTINNAGLVNLTGTAKIATGTISGLLQGGTATNLAGTFSSPVVSGTATYPVNANTASLASNDLFAFQTKAGSAILVIRSGGTNFFFSPSGTF